MQKIGTIKFVQVQQDSLKDHLADGTRIYNPTPLLQLNRIKLTTDGVIGLTDNDDTIIDVHNTRHPNSRYRGDNPISIGFTSHYNKMREEMGDHLKDGIAGESIIVECDQVYTPDILNHPLAIKNAQTDAIIYLNEVIPIPPCEPFSRFARNKDLSPQETKSTLQFLSNGTRGFYMKLEAPSESVIIQAGDVVYQMTD